MMGSETVWYRGTRFRLGRGQLAMRCGQLTARRTGQWSGGRKPQRAGPRVGAVHLVGTTRRDRTSQPAHWPAAPGRRGAGLLGAGVLCGVASLFPGYLAGKSLASQPGLLVSHLAYLAVWAASAALIWSGGHRLRVGALLGLGTSVVTFGFFLSDAGQVIAGGARLLGAGLVLGTAGWLACTAGGALAVRIPAAWRTPLAAAPALGRLADPGRGHAGRGRRGVRLRPVLGQVHATDRDRGQPDADGRKQLRESGTRAGRRHRRDGWAGPGRGGRGALAPGPAGRGAARRGGDPDGGRGGHGADPGGRANQRGPVRHLASPGCPGGPDHQRQRYRSVLDLLWLRACPGHDLRLAAPAGPPAGTAGGRWIPGTAGHRPGAGRQAVA